MQNHFLGSIPDPPSPYFTFLRVVGFIASVNSPYTLWLNFHLSLICNQCVIQLSILLLLCCPVQGKSLKSGRTLNQEISRRNYRRGSEKNIRSSEMLLHDEWYIVTHFKKKRSAVQIFDLEFEGVTFFRNVDNTLSVRTT